MSTAIENPVCVSIAVSSQSVLSVESASTLQPKAHLRAKEVFKDGKVLVVFFSDGKMVADGEIIVVDDKLFIKVNDVNADWQHDYNSDPVNIAKKKARFIEEMKNER